MSWKKLTDFPNQTVIGEFDIVYWKIEGNKVWHQWKKMTKPDVDSFEIYEGENFIARDKSFIYNAWNKQTKIDRDTFEKSEGPYWKDKNYIYFEYETGLKPILDAKNFVYLGNGYSHDKHFAYGYGTKIRSCKKPTTLKLIQENHSFLKDEDHIYYSGNPLKGVDLLSWRLLTDSYSCDDKRIYCGFSKLPKLDISTWEYIGKGFSKDKNRVYSAHYIMEDAIPKKWDIKKVNEYTQKENQEIMKNMKEFIKMLKNNKTSI